MQRTLTNPPAMEETRQAEGQIEAAGTQTRGRGCPDPQGGRAAARGGTRRGGSVRRRGSAAPSPVGEPASSRPRGLGPAQSGGVAEGAGSPGIPGACVSALDFAAPAAPSAPSAVWRGELIPKGAGGVHPAPPERPWQEPVSLYSLLVSAPQGSQLPWGRSGEGRHKRTRTGEGTPPSSCFCTDLYGSWGRRLDLGRESQSGFDFRIWKIGSRAAPASHSIAQIAATASAASARDGTLHASPGCGDPGHPPCPPRLALGLPGAPSGSHTPKSLCSRPAPALLCQRPRQAPARSGLRGEGGCAPAPTGARRGRRGRGGSRRREWVEAGVCSSPLVTFFIPVPIQCYLNSYIFSLIPDSTSWLFCSYTKAIFVRDRKNGPSEEDS